MKKTLNPTNFIRSRQREKQDGVKYSRPRVRTLTVTATKKKEKNEENTLTSDRPVKPRRTTYRGRRQSIVKREFLEQAF